MENERLYLVCCYGSIASSAALFLLFKIWSACRRSAPTNLQDDRNCELMVGKQPFSLFSPQVLFVISSTRFLAWISIVMGFAELWRVARTRCGRARNTMTVGKKCPIRCRCPHELLLLLACFHVVVRAMNQIQKVDLAILDELTAHGCDPFAINSESQTVSKLRPV